MSARFVNSEVPWAHGAGTNAMVLQSLRTGEWQGLPSAAGVLSQALNLPSHWNKLYSSMERLIGLAMVPHVSDCTLCPAGMLTSPFVLQVGYRSVDKCWPAACPQFAAKPSPDDCHLDSVLSLDASPQPSLASHGDVTFQAHTSSVTPSGDSHLSTNDSWVYLQP